MNNAGHKEVPVDDHTVSLCHIGKYDENEEQIQMIIIKGNNPRKINKIWELVKKEHTGKKIAIIGYPGGIPHNFIRAKQMPAYETMTKHNILDDLTRFLKETKDRFKAIILYIDCESHLIDSITETTTSYKEKFILTVYDEKVYEQVVDGE
ncbi:hypothetical protein IGJ02_001587 [Enterococcus sp. DIV0724b]|uniref:hypothetical protein n=1 Tax=Enterococcus sp. DIV0724b TaxID=2774694 RepID=UPI003D2FB79D